jgi:dihydroorotate dehydrogenase electron transfer subunit
MLHTTPLSLTAPVVDEYPVTIVRNTAYASGLHHLVLRFSQGVGHNKAHLPVPGQFFMLDVQDAVHGFRFRRPFSLYRWDPATQIGEVVYKISGQGTALMAEWKSGDTSTVLSSLGVGVPECFYTAPETVLLVGGGVGIAPLALWAESLQHDGRYPKQRPTLVFGVRSHTEAEPLLPHLNMLTAPDSFQLCTDDGSAGWHGNPTHWLEANHQNLGHIRNVFVCGPNRMMQSSVQALGRLLPSAEVYVSLENHMPCGTGACYGCVVAPASSNALPLKVCEAGPVLRADTLKWNATGPETIEFSLDAEAFPPLCVEGLPPA